MRIDTQCTQDPVLKFTMSSANGDDDGSDDKVDGTPYSVIEDEEDEDGDEDDDVEDDKVGLRTQ